MFLLDKNIEKCFSTIFQFLILIINTKLIFYVLQISGKAENLHEHNNIRRESCTHNEGRKEGKINIKLLV